MLPKSSLRILLHLPVATEQDGECEDFHSVELWICASPGLPYSELNQTQKIFSCDKPGAHLRTLRTSPSRGLLAGVAAVSTGREAEDACLVSAVSSDSGGSVFPALGDGVAEPVGRFSSWKRRRSGLQMCLAEGELPTDVGCPGAAAAVVGSEASGEGRGGFIFMKAMLPKAFPCQKSGQVLSYAVPFVWNFSADPQNTWHTSCSLYKVCQAGQGLFLEPPLCSSTTAHTPCMLGWGLNRMVLMVT